MLEKGRSNGVRRSSHQGWVDLIADGCHGVIRYQPDCERIMRMHAQPAMIENGFVYIPQDAPWLAEYLH